MRESCHYARAHCWNYFKFFMHQLEPPRGESVRKCAVVPPGAIIGYLSATSKSRSNFLSISRRNIQIWSICIFIISAECEIKQKHARPDVFLSLACVFAYFFYRAVGFFRERGGCTLGYRF